MEKIVYTFLQKIPSLVASRLSEVLALRDTRERKDDGSYVTKGDLLLQDILINHARESIPCVSFVSEEMSNELPLSLDGLTVVIDPIDGTENFTSGLAEWGVSISCYHGNRHIGSLIGAPELNQWLSSNSPKGPKHVSRIRGLSSSLSKEDLINATQGYEYRVMGCCVYNMLNVIRGSFFSFENPKGACSWDILAGLNLALEHGLSVTVNQKNYAGEYLPPDHKYRFKIENR